MLNFGEAEGDEESLADLEPIDFFNNSILYIIIKESNKSAIQVNPPVPLKLTRDNLEQFIGILYTTSMVKMASTRLYWSKEFDFEKIANTMTVNKFKKIENFLHCNNNLNHPEDAQIGFIK